MFEADKLRELGMNPDHLYPTVLQRPPPLSADKEKRVKNAPSWFASWFARDEPVDEEGPTEILSEEHEELHDALSPKYDQLMQKPGWWLLEYMPMKYRYQLPNNNWASRVGFVVEIRSCMRDVELFSIFVVQVEPRSTPKNSRTWT